MHADLVAPGKILLVAAREVRARHPNACAGFEFDLEQGDVAEIAHPLDRAARDLVAFGRILRRGLDRIPYAGVVAIACLWAYRDPHVGHVRAACAIVELARANHRTVDRRLSCISLAYPAFEHPHTYNQITPQ